MIVHVGFVFFLQFSYVMMCDIFLRLADYGLLMAAPPCSLFVGMSASVHQRSVTCLNWSSYTQSFNHEDPPGTMK